MFHCLICIILFSLSAISFAQEAEEVVQFSKSKKWRKILYYNGNDRKAESLIKGDMFFLHSEGKDNPLLELKETIKLFQSDGHHKNGHKASCVFTARYELLRRKWPKNFKEQKCDEFEKWLTGLDAGKLYLVYSSAYPNNPASMFGHTFLRFDRLSRSNEKLTNEFLGYSLAFQARTDPNDNAFMYTLKGVMGGYHAFLDIRPHYMNIGMYNNSESRDLWEYPINLNTDEKKLLLAHLWELSTTAAFDYYFFDENCSTFLIRMLEAIKPDWNFQSKKTLFVVPQETLKEIVSKTQIAIPHQRVSIKKKILAAHNRLNTEQQKLFASSKNDIQKIEKIQDTKVLDVLIDYSKYQNYKYFGSREGAQSEILYAALLQRASFPIKTIENEYPVQKEMAPHLGHPLSKMNFNIGEDSQKIGLRYGFHDFHDPKLGMDNGSFITFMDLTAKLENEKWLLNQVKVADILSLQNFYWNFPQLSWRGGLQYQKNSNETLWNGFGGIGIAKSQESNLQWFLLTTLNFRSRLELASQTISPGINGGFRYNFENKNVWISIETFGIVENEKMIYQSILGLNFYKNDYLITPNISINDNSGTLRLQISKYF